LIFAPNDEIRMGMGKTELIAVHGFSLVCFSEILLLAF